MVVYCWPREPAGTVTLGECGFKGVAGRECWRYHANTVKQFCLALVVVRDKTEVRLTSMSEFVRIAACTGDGEAW
jgi:hypothetical protein